jgi:RNA polymerase-binding transcription factor DksA
MSTTVTGTGLSRASPGTEALTRLRELLLEELSVQVDQADEQRRTATELKTDPTTSIGQFELDRELAEAIVARSQEAIGDIESALARMDAGTYGDCERCAAPIPLERLEAIPHARFCVTCQGRRDARR